MITALIIIRHHTSPNIWQGWSSSGLGRHHWRQVIKPKILYHHHHHHNDWDQDIVNISNDNINTRNNNINTSNINNNKISNNIIKQQPPTKAATWRDLLNRDKIINNNNNNKIILWVMRESSRMAIKM